MNCSNCGISNPEKARFCSGCGSAMDSIECHHCQQKNKPGSRFCNACGNALADSPVEQVEPSQAERRLLTVLFCDLVESTQLAEALDPEFMRSIIRNFQTLSREAVEQMGGRITEYLGDGIVAQFTGHETNAERAINAALKINRRLNRENIKTDGTDKKVAVRCGIATGMAVVGDMLGDSRIRSESAVGLPLNLAARIQNIANSSEVVIGDTTHQLTRGLFEFESYGEHSLKGFAEPQKVWRVVAEQSISSRFVAHAAEMTPMVDREDVMEQLLSRWEQSKQGEAVAVVFIGEPGIGKSRIAQEFANKISKNSLRAMYQCSSYHTNTALYPLIRGVEVTARIEHFDDNATRLRKVERLLRWSSDNYKHDTPAILNLLSISAEDKWPTPNLDPDEIKQWIFTAVINHLKSLSARKPLLIQIEDVHWIDPTTLEIMTRLVEELIGHPVLLLITSRPGFSNEFTRHPHVCVIEVGKLPKEYRKHLVEQVKGDSKLLDPIIDEIIERTEGVPLFIEELSKSLLESAQAEGSGKESSALAKKDIPTSLHDSLLSRLDHLPAESRSIAHLASVIGREFSYNLLEKIAKLKNRNLYELLSPLLEAQLVTQLKAPPNAEFSFKHALVRDVAYETLLKSDRVKIHKNIAESIETFYSDTCTKNPALLAYHHTEGVNYQKAVEYRLQAGKKASQKSANIEARNHLETALQLLEKLPNTVDTEKLELQILIYLGAILKISEGSATKVTRTTYDKIICLCEKLPESPAHFSGLWGKWHNSLNFKKDHGLEWTDKLQQLADQLEGDEYKLQACHAKWTTLFHLGRFSEAYKQMNTGMEFYDQRRDYFHASKYGGHDPYVCLMGFGSHALWLMGNIEHSLEKAQECVKISLELNHTGSILQSIEANILLHQFRKDPVMVLKWVKKLDEYIKPLELPAYRGMGLIHRGWAVACQGESEKGLSMMEEGLAIRNKRSNKEDGPLYSDMFAEIFSKMGRQKKALNLVKKAISASTKKGYLYWLAELIRREGEIHLKAGREQAAEACFLQSLEISEEQGARSLALRAAVSLARIYLKNQSADKGQQILAPICLGFKDGQDSSELKAAKALCSELRV